VNELCGSDVTFGIEWQSVECCGFNRSKDLVNRNLLLQRVSQINLSSTYILLGSYRCQYSNLFWYRIVYFGVYQSVCREDGGGMSLRNVINLNYYTRN